VEVVATHLATSVDNRALFAELKDRYLASLPDYRAPDMDKQIKVRKEGGREGEREGGLLSPTTKPLIGTSRSR
jgi:hypothetical protein